MKADSLSSMIATILLLIVACVALPTRLGAVVDSTFLQSPPDGCSIYAHSGTCQTQGFAICVSGLGYCTATARVTAEGCVNLVNILGWSFITNSNDGVDAEVILSWNGGYDQADNITYCDGSVNNDPPLIGVGC